MPETIVDGAIELIEGLPQPGVGDGVGVGVVVGAGVGVGFGVGVGPPGLCTSKRARPLVIPVSKFECTIGNSSIFDLDLPLPSARQHDWPTGTLASLEKILEPLQLDIRQMRLKYPRDTFFSKGCRAAWLKAQGLTYEWEPDSLNPGFQSLRLCFALQRGAYATMVVRYLFNEAIESEPDEELSDEELSDEVKSG